MYSQIYREMCPLAVAGYVPGGWGVYDLKSKMWVTWRVTEERAHEDIVWRMHCNPKRRLEVRKMDDCPKCGYPDVTSGENAGQHFKGIYTPGQKCSNCGYRDESVSPARPHEHLYFIDIPVQVRDGAGPVTDQKPLKVRVLASSPQDAVEKVSLELQRTIRREWGG